MQKADSVTLNTPGRYFKVIKRPEVETEKSLLMKARKKPFVILKKVLFKRF